MFLSFVFTALCVAVGVKGRIVNFEDAGAVADEFGLETAWNNGRIMNETLNSLEPGQRKQILFSQNINLLFLF